MRTWHARAGAFGLLVVLLAASTTLWAQDGVVRLDVTIGKSQVLELKEPFTRVSVTNPAVADVYVVTPTQILISGKAVGVTSLVVFYPRRTLFFDVAVQTDLTLLRERLKALSPRDEIQVQPAQDGIVLSGTVSSEAIVSGALEVAGLFAPRGRVINLMTLAEARPQQVLLQVHVAEVVRNALRELGFSTRALGNQFQGGAFPGDPFFQPIGALGPASIGGNSSLLDGALAAAPDLLFPGASFFLSSGARDYAGIARALSSRGLLRTLAKPNLVTQSGREAKFISGGEFPYPVAQDNNTITIQFKEFGVGLLFTPVVVDGENIALKIRPEVSSLDFSNALTQSGFTIPTIRKNQAMTSINLRDGESFAIAGMINNEVRQNVGKIPLLGDIPIIGALFRSVRFQNNETELLFLVTVKLVKAGPPGTEPDPRSLMELRKGERDEFTLVPGIPGVGEIVERPFGESNLPGPRK